MSNPAELTIQQRQARSMERRLFFLWPVVELPEDVARVTLFGFWVCFALAVANGVKAVIDVQASREAHVAMSPWAYSVLVAVPLFYFLAANALRRASWPAAVMLLVYLLTDTLAQRVLDGKFYLPNVAECVLFLVIARGIWLASHRTVADVPPLTDFMSTGLRGLLAYRLPKMIWPRFQVVFWILAVVGELTFLYPLTPAS